MRLLFATFQDFLFQRVFLKTVLTFKYNFLKISNYFATMKKKIVILRKCKTKKNKSLLGLWLTLVTVVFFFPPTCFCCCWQQTAAGRPTDWTSRPAIIGKSCCQGPTSIAAREAYLRHLFSLPGTSPTIRAAAQSAAIFTPHNPPTARPPVWNTYCQIQLGCGEKRKNRCECFTLFSPISAWERTCFDLRSLSFPISTWLISSASSSSLRKKEITRNSGKLLLDFVF